MISRRLVISALVSGVSASTFGQQPRPPAKAVSKEFTDPVYGYTLRLPAAWTPYPRTAGKGEPSQRLSLSTPNKNTLVVSVTRLPRPVANHTEFEKIAQSYVDPVLAAYLKSFEIDKIVGEQKEDKSDARSMRFWQGTSGFHSSIAPAVVVSTHTIRYGSNLIVNIVYVNGDDSESEMKSVDTLMNSLTFADTQAPRPTVK